jgi:diguanylate cyclase (GGDEF)-like protein
MATASMRSRSGSRSNAVRSFVVATCVLAALLAGVVALVDVRYWHGSLNWAAIATILALYLVGEVFSVGWLGRRGGGEVTPGWAFAYTLLLLGSPSVAIAATAVATVLPDIVRRKGLLRGAFNVGQTVISMSSACLLLTVVGCTKPLSVSSDVNMVWLVTIALAGVLIFVVNSVLTSIVIALNHGVAIPTLLRQATNLSVSADAALLALSPLFAVSIDFSLGTAPLLALIAYLVFNSARQALEREHRASHDHLTSLLNARAFLDHLNGHLESRGRLAMRGCVMLLDLDGFKQVNDRLGHHVGDAVLSLVGSRLRFDRDLGATASRLGGDEFAVLFPETADRDQALALAWGVAKSLSEPLEIDGFPLTVRASIGVVPLDSTFTSPDDVLRTADVAMYEAKRGRSTVALAPARGEDEVSGGRLSLLAGLSEALAVDDQLQIAYQPIVDLTRGGLVGMEALLRWRHPQLGLVMPAEFMTLAENTDLIDAVTAKVVDLVARDAARFLDIAPALRLAVNVSTRNLRSRHFPSEVAAILARYGVDPSHLVIELTESAFDAQPDLTPKVVAELRANGHPIAIDDFGAGYSWFSRLLELPIDMVKIDRALIGQAPIDERRFLVVKSIVELAHGMGFTCTAEGVEDIEMLHQLRAIGCDAAQGFAIARPMFRDDAVNWLAQHPLGFPLTLEEAL